MNALFACLEALPGTIRARAMPATLRVVISLVLVIAMGLHGVPAAATPGWSWIAPTPTPYTLRHVAQLGSGVAIAVGDHNTLLKTSDGGTTWTSSEVPFVSSEGGFQAVRLVDGERALAVGG